MELSDWHRRGRRLWLQRLRLLRSSLCAPCLTTSGAPTSGVILEPSDARSASPRRGVNTIATYPTRLFERYGPAVERGPLPAPKGAARGAPRHRVRGAALPVPDTDLPVSARSSTNAFFRALAWDRNAACNIRARVASAAAWASTEQLKPLGVPSVGPNHGLPGSEGVTETFGIPYLRGCCVISSPHCPSPSGIRWVAARERLAASSETGGVPLG